MKQNITPEENSIASSKKLIKKFAVNQFYLVFYVVSIGITGACVAWTTAGNN